MSWAYEFEGDWSSLLAAADHGDDWEATAALDFHKAADAAMTQVEKLLAEYEEVSGRYTVLCEHLMGPLSARVMALRSWPEIKSFLGDLLSGYLKRANGPLKRSVVVFHKGLKADYRTIFGSEPVSTEAGRQGPLHLFLIIRLTV